MTRINSLYGSKTSPVILCMQNILISTRITSLHGSQTSPVVLCLQNSVISNRITSLHGSQTSPVLLCIQNNVIRIRITRLWVPALICGFYKQNSDFWIRITSLYRSQPTFVAFTCKTATFGSELQVSMGPSPHLWFLQSKQQL